MLIDFESIVRIHFSLKVKRYFYLPSGHTCLVLSHLEMQWKWNAWLQTPHVTVHSSLEFGAWLAWHSMPKYKWVSYVTKGYDEFWHSCVSLWGFGIINTYKGPWCGFCKWRSCQRGCLHTERISIDDSYLPQAQSATAFHFLISNFFDVSTIFRLFNLIF